MILNYFAANLDGRITGGYSKVTFNAPSSLFVAASCTSYDCSKVPIIITQSPPYFTSSGFWDWSVSVMFSLAWLKDLMQMIWFGHLGLLINILGSTLDVICEDHTQCKPKPVGSNYVQYCIHTCDQGSDCGDKSNKFGSYRIHQIQYVLAQHSIHTEHNGLNHTDATHFSSPPHAQQIHHPKRFIARLAEVSLAWCFTQKVLISKSNLLSNT